MDRVTVSTFVAACVALGASPAFAAPTLRKAIDTLGDFALIGNTFAHNCSDKTPTVGTVTSCTDTFTDASPDVYWQADSSSATAGPAITPALSRTTAVLTLPTGGRVQYAALYWFGTAKAADSTCVLERPGGNTLNVTADQTHSGTASNPSAVKAENKTLVQFLSVADVTDFVSVEGPGAYRVSGVDGPDLADNHGAAERGWSLVVFYDAPGEPPRNLVLFDGIDGILGATVSVPLSGFKVPAVFSGKLGIVGIDGEVTGASLRFGPQGSPTALSDAQNPVDFFFNGTRSWLGQPVTVAGDLPQSSGTAKSNGGIDMDVVDITSKLSAGMTSAEAQIAAGPGDGIINFVWVTSITTIAPVLVVNKTVKDENGAPVLEGDTLEYTVSVTNKGNDPSAATVFEDVLDPGLEYVAGSLETVSGATTSKWTDAAGDDQGEWDATSKKLTVRLGTGATSSAGGALGPNDMVQVRFRAKVQPGTVGKVIGNQASVSAKGASGAATATTLSDDPNTIGNQPTNVTVASPPDGGVDGSAGAAGSASGGSSGSSGSGGTSGGGSGGTGAASVGGSGGTGGGSSGSGGKSGGSGSGADSGDDGGCGCRAPSSGSGSGASLALLALLAFFARRRR
ncbi:MAG: isopeptide-forming domain-containing fimbrial protein [Polyangiaceae bacterium]